MGIAASPVAPRPDVAFDRSSDLIALARARRDRVRWVDVPERRFLAIDGDGPPGEAIFQEAIATLYPVAYTLHFALRRRGLTAPVGMLEGLYWLPPLDLAPSAAIELGNGPGPSGWRLMLAVPSEAGEVDVEGAIVAAARRRPLPLPSLLRVIGFHEGPSAQLLYVGPYADEGDALHVLHAAIGDAGFVPRGPHHEIYLNDPRQVGDARAKTVLRQPVAPAEQ